MRKEDAKGRKGEDGYEEAFDDYNKIVNAFEKKSVWI